MSTSCTNSDHCALHCTQCTECIWIGFIEDGLTKRAYFSSCSSFCSKALPLYLSPFHCRHMWEDNPRMTILVWLTVMYMAKNMRIFELSQKLYFQLNWMRNVRNRCIVFYLFLNYNDWLSKLHWPQKCRLTSLYIINRNLGCMQPNNWSLSRRFKKYLI